MTSPAPSTTPHHLLARAASTPLPSAPPADIMWMPGGVHDISATRNGKAAKLRVRVDREVAATMQRALEEILASGRQRPFFDFNHDDKEASGWPLAFFWSDTPEPGVYARVEWSEAGAQAIAGHGYRSFSPSFFIREEAKGEPAVVVGGPLNLGGLTNNPAFRALVPIWSRHAETPSDPIMNESQNQGAGAAGQSTPTTPAAAPAAPAAAAQPRAGGQPDAVTIEIHDAKGAIQAKDAELERLRGENERLSQQIAERRKIDAKAAVEAAVARGAIPAQDTAIQAKWQARIETDPEAATLLAAIPGHPAVGAGRIITPETSGASGSGDVRVTATDLRHTIEAYGLEPDAAVRARIWKADIRPRVEKESLDLVEPVQAIQRDIRTGKIDLVKANTLGTLSGILVVQRALDFLKYSFPILTRISTNFSDQAAKFGQTINTRLRSGLSATTFNSANGYEDQAVTTTDVDVVINTHKYVQVKFGVEELASTMRGLFDEQEEPMHYALGEALVDALYALITAGNYAGATNVTLANFDRHGVIAIGTAMTKAKVPPNGRTLLLNSDYYGQLASDESIVRLASYQQPGIITTGQLPDVHGFRPIEAPNLPSTGNLAGFAFRPDAWAMATRPPSDYTTALPGVPSTGIVQMVTNPDTGITVMLVQWVDHLAGAARGRVALMYGVAKGQTTSGRRLVNTAG